MYGWSLEFIFLIMIPESDSTSLRICLLGLARLLSRSECLPWSWRASVQFLRTHMERTTPANYLPTSNTQTKYVWRFVQNISLGVIWVLKKADFKKSRMVKDSSQNVESSEAVAELLPCMLPAWYSGQRNWAGGTCLNPRVWSRSRKSRKPRSSLATP